MMLNDKGIDPSITSTDDILFGPEYAYTRVVRIALMDGERKASEVAVFTGPYDYTRARIMDGVQGWAFIVSLSQGQSGLNALMSLTKADRRLIMDRLVRSAAENNGNIFHVMGIHSTEYTGEIEVLRETSNIYGARLV